MCCAGRSDGVTAAVKEGKKAKKGANSSRQYIKKIKKGRHDRVKNKHELLPILTATVLEYTSKSETTEQAELIYVIQKELKVPCIREIFIYYYDMSKHEIKDLRNNEIFDFFSDKVIPVLASDSNDSNKG